MISHMKSMASMSTCSSLPSSSRSISSSISLRPQGRFPREAQPANFPGISWRLVRGRPNVLLPAPRGSIDLIRPGGAVESDKLPSDVRKRALEAVDSCGGRVTIGDVASRAGIKLNEAQRALQAIAADAGGFLEVSDEGDVLYVFPKDYGAKLAAKSFRIKIEPWLDKAKGAAENLVRVSFGTALITSIVLVFTAIVAIILSISDENYQGSCGGISYGSGFKLSFTPTDLFWYWDPYYYKRPQVQANDERMNSIESVFSFVFGDGDPNQGIEEERWKLIGQYVASNGGVVAAEELAPYLDIQKKPDMSDESYILPVLLRFDGQPEIDEEGNILYRFPSLQRTASPQRSGRNEYVGRRCADLVDGVEKFVNEKKWQFSKTRASERAMVIGLGGLNLFVVIILGIMLKSYSVVPSGFIKFVASIFPLLQVYAVSFFAIPLIRWILTCKRNAEIETRNEARLQSARALEQPDISLRRKVLNAQDMAQKTVIGQDRIVYSTNQDLFDQDYEAREWDSKFREIERSD